MVPLETVILDTNVGWSWLLVTPEGPESTGSILPADIDKIRSQHLLNLMSRYGFTDRETTHVHEFIKKFGGPKNTKESGWHLSVRRKNVLASKVHQHP